MPLLRVSAGEAQGTEYLLDRPSVVLGQAATCDIRLQGAAIAPFHARLHHLYEVVMLEDLGSAGGVLVNGKRISTRCQLHEGDTIHLGEIELVFGWCSLANAQEANRAATITKEGPLQEARLKVKKQQEASIWKQMEKRLSLAQMKPQGITEVVARSFVSVRGETYYVLKNKRNRTYLRLDPQQYELWTLMDGTRTVQELTVEYFTRFGALSFSKVMGLIEQLYSHGFFVEQPVRVYDRLGAKLKRRRTSHLVDVAVQRFLQTRFPLRHLDRRLESMYRSVAWPFYSRAANRLYLLIILAGFALFVLQLVQGTAILNTNGQSLGAGLVILLVAYFLTLAVHELAHALTVKHFGGEVHEGGVMLYFGSPALFANTTDIWLSPRRARILASWSGPYSSLIIAGGASIASFFLPHSSIGQVLFQAAFMFFLGSLLNMNPLLELDGYFMLMDYLEIPLLRRKALAFLQDRLLVKLRKRESFQKEERILLVFGLLAWTWSAFAIVTAVYFWVNHLSGFVVSLWMRPDWWWKALAGLLVLVFSIPLVLVPVNLGLRTFQRLRLQWRLRRRKALAARYQQDVLALKKLPFLAAIPEEQLLPIARQLQPRAFISGSFVVRQGERGDCFYLIREGTVEVLEDQGPDALPRHLRDLGPGDYFGEIALIRDVPRTASVRAMSNVTTLALGREAFQRLLQPHFELYERSKRMVEDQEALTSIPLFASLKPKERDLLTSKLTLRRFEEGEMIVEQGTPGEYFYLIKQGRVSVSMLDSQGRSHELRTLGPGQYFGEIALLLSAPRTASVRAMEAVETWMLHRADFTDLLTSYLAVDAGALATLSGSFNAPVDLIPLEHRSLLR
jgi:CRP-like cAMP-binding protein/pSer/pThr/pTyr-binding forkhead associated (FHA) protein